MLHGKDNNGNIFDFFQVYNHRIFYSFNFFRCRMTSFHVDPSLHEDKGKIKSRIDCIVTYLEENRQNIFYLFVFYVITIALFVHQFICKCSYNFQTVYFLSITLHHPSYLYYILFTNPFFRLFVFGRTYWSPSHNGSRHSVDKRIRGIFVVRILFIIAHNVEKSADEAKRFLYTAVYTTGLSHTIPQSDCLHCILFFYHTHHRSYNKFLSRFHPAIRKYSLFDVWNTLSVWL